jgi:hypothetical protein
VFGFIYNNDIFDPVLSRKFKGYELLDLNGHVITSDVVKEIDWLPKTYQVVVDSTIPTRDKSYCPRKRGKARAGLHDSYAIARCEGFPIHSDTVYFAEIGYSLLACG